jgi:hypothetical protein
MEAAAEKYGVRTQAMSLTQRHPGLQPVRPCFIGGAGDHTAAPGVATDHHRLAPQGRVEHLLHRDKESVEVNMQYATSHSIFFCKNICSNLL